MTLYSSLLNPFIAYKYSHLRGKSNKQVKQIDTKFDIINKIIVLVSREKFSKNISIKPMAWIKFKIEKKVIKKTKDILWLKRKNSDESTSVKTLLILEQR